MSNDLISRSALSKKICNKECEVELNAFLLGLNAKQIVIMECICDLPTAYDVDKVIEQLEEKSFIPGDMIGVSDTKIIMAEKAIDTVKSGGVE